MCDTRAVVCEARAVIYDTIGFSRVGAVTYIGLGL